MTDDIVKRLRYGLIDTNTSYRYQQEAADEIEKLRAENEDLQGEIKFERHNTSELFRVVIEPKGKQIAKLRAALKFLAEYDNPLPSDDYPDNYPIDFFTWGDLRAAKSALKETGDD